MRAAPLTSPRLQRVLKLLSDGLPHTTRDIVRRARVVAVSACIAELRQHGADITCSQRVVDHGIRLFDYQMKKGPSHE